VNTAAQAKIRAWKAQGLTDERVKELALDQATKMFGFLFCNQLPEGTDQDAWIDEMEDLKEFAQGRLEIHDS
jgi:hypothetical protein